MIFAVLSPNQRVIIDKIENDVAKIITGRCPIFERIKVVVHKKRGIAPINTKPDETSVEYKTAYQIVVKELWSRILALSKAKGSTVIKETSRGERRRNNGVSQFMNGRFLEITLGKS